MLSSSTPIKRAYRPLNTKSIREFGKLMETHPWPQDRPGEPEDAFRWSLDGGGRHLMKSIFEQTNIRLMLEIGSFMNGSAQEWLDYSPDLKLICLDPWPDNLVGYVEGLTKTEWAKKIYSLEDLSRYAAILRKTGTIAAVRNNLWHRRDQVVMVQGTAPDDYAKVRATQPDLVYIDAMKKRPEFIEAHEAFPDAIITGDDWTWPDATGNFPVREIVTEVARLRDARVYADRQTFVVAESRHNLTFDEKYRFAI